MNMESKDFGKQVRTSVKHTSRRRGSPIFSYPGSKWRLMPKLMRHFPPHDHYVSVFGGSATDILVKPPSKFETYNDLDQNLYSLFKLLQDSIQLEQLVHKIQLTPSCCQDQYLEAVDTLKGGAANPVVRAWAFLVVAHQGAPSRSASIQRPTEWLATYIPNSSLNTWGRLPSIIQQVAVRFRNVQIVNRDWGKVITPGEGFDRPDTFFFTDPQYHPSTLRPNAKYYFESMNHSDHERLLAALTQIEGRAMICGYDSELYRDVLGNWRTSHFSTRTSMDVGGSRNKRTEIIWMNYDPCGRQLRRSK